MTAPGWSRDAIAKRAAQDLPTGAYVNLGIGLPTLVANHLTAEQGVTLQSENGVLGVGPYPATAADADPDWINAGKETISVHPGAVTFDSSMSFAMIRSGRIDCALLGALEVAMNGDLANWMVPGKMVKGMGGAMDLVCGAKRVVVLTDHTTKSGAPKLLEAITLPATGRAVVDEIITNLGVFVPTGQGFRVRELAPGVDIEAVRAQTAAPVES